MKIFNPNNSEHTIQINCRDNDAAEVTLILKNKLRDTSNSYAISCTKVSGYLTGNFTHTFKEGQSFEVEVYNEEALLYRGKAYATTQTDLQNYKLTK